MSKLFGVTSQWTELESLSPGLGLMIRTLIQRYIAPAAAQQCNQGFTCTF